MNELTWKQIILELKGLKDFGMFKATDEEHCRARFTILINGLNNIIVSPDFGENKTKTVYLIDMMIGIIPDKNEREFINQKFKKMINESGLNDKEKIKEISDDDRKHILVRMNLSIIGDINDAINKYYSSKEIIIEQSIREGD